MRETDSTYTLVSADQGKTIKVKVTFTDDADNQESLTSAATATVAAKPNAAPTGLPTISGTARVDETLTADTSDIADDDGLADATFTYQWAAGGADISGATSSTYFLTSSEQGQTIQVQVSFTDDADNQERLTSEATAAVAPRSYGTVWSADMLVVEYTQTSIGAASADLFSNIGGSGGLRIQSLWSYTPDRDLRLAFEEAVPDADDLTVIVDELELAFLPGSSGDGSFKWTDVDLDWEDGQTIAVRIVLTSTLAEPTPNTPATGLPTISGTAQVDQTLTADITGIADADGLTNVSYSYQWIRSDNGTDANIAGQTDSTYTLVSTDEGKTIKVRVTFTDDADNQETLTSGATATVAAKPNSPATGLPTVSGTAQVRETLTADTSGIADEDGLTSVLYSYQWVVNDGTTDTDILNATASIYTPSVSDVGKTITVKVSFIDDGDHAESLTSAATDAVLAAVPTGPLSLTVTRGSQIQELDASWQAPASDGGSAITGYKVQWKEAADSWDTAADVSEATVTGTTHTITELIGGQEYTVRVIATNAAGDGPASTEVKGTPAGGVSEQNTEPENTAPTGLPSISGTPQVDQTLTAATSDIADEDGLDDVSYSYQWVANDGTTDTDILNATASIYTPSVSDVGKAIKVKVSFTDDADNQETLTSVATDAVAATKPGVPGHLNVSPHDTGALDVYWEAPASDGGSDVTDYRVQWKKTTGSWDAAADVAEATVTGTTHTITGLSDGVEYRVRVMAMNDVGEGLPSAERSGIPRETRAPEKVIPRVNGATLRVQYDEALDEGSVPAANAFDVRITCQCDSKRWWHEEARRGVDGVTVDGDTVVLTLAIPADAGDGVVVSYTPPPDAAAARTRDLAGNAAAGYVATEVSNDTEEDAGAEETGEGETALTVSLENVPESHHGTGVFTFEIRFSEEVRLSYKTLRDHAFTVTGGSVVKAQRTDKPSNIPWRITVRPESDGEVTIILPATTKCAALRAICTADGNKLSGPPGPTDPLTFTVSGPGG